MSHVQERIVDSSITELPDLGSIPGDLMLALADVPPPPSGGATLGALAAPVSRLVAAISSARSVPYLNVGAVTEGAAALPTLAAALRAQPDIALSRGYLPKDAPPRGTTHTLAAHLEAALPALQAFVEHLETPGEPTATT